MKYGRLNRLFPITIALLVVALIGLSGCSENAESSFVVPTFEEPLPPPVEVTIDQLYQEYMADEAAAEVKYKGKGLLFYEVEVEQVVGNYMMMAEALGAASEEYVKLYFTAGFIKFRLRGVDFGIMQNIEEGYVLNIVGECRGLYKGFVIIDDCWVESVIGDIGTGGEVEFY